MIGPNHRHGAPPDEEPEVQRVEVDHHALAEPRPQQAERCKVEQDVGEAHAPDVGDAVRLELPARLAEALDHPLGLQLPAGHKGQLLEQPVGDADRGPRQERCEQVLQGKGTVSRQASLRESTASNCPKREVSTESSFVTSIASLWKESAQRRRTLSLQGQRSVA